MRDREKMVERALTIYPKYRAQFHDFIRTVAECLEQVEGFEDIQLSSSLSNNFILTINNIGGAREIIIELISRYLCKNAEISGD